MEPSTYDACQASKWLKSSLEKLSDKSLWHPWGAALGAKNGAQTTLPALLNLS